MKIGRGGGWGSKHGSQQEGGTGGGKEGGDRVKGRGHPAWKCP